MTLFPLILNIVFVILIYFLHKKVFYGTVIFLTVLYIVGAYWIMEVFRTTQNQILYFLALEGICLVIGIIAFMTALFIRSPEPSSPTHE